MASFQGSAPAAGLGASSDISGPEQLALWLYSCGETKRIAWCKQALFDRDELLALRAEVRSLRLTMLTAVHEIDGEVTEEEAIAARLVRASLNPSDQPITDPSL